MADERLHSAIPGHARVSGSVEDAELEVTLQSGERRAIDDPDPASWPGLAEREGQVPSLLHSHHATTDCRPVSLFSVQTTRRIGTKTGFAVDVRHFHAHVFLDLGGAFGFAKDRFVGRTLRIGELGACASMAWIAEADGGLMAARAENT